jgi:hypothetical protein
VIRFLEAVGILLGIGACFALFFIMLFSAIASDWDDRRDRARPYTRDV